MSSKILMTKKKRCEDVAFNHELWISSNATYPTVYIFSFLYICCITPIPDTSIFKLCHMPFYLSNQYPLLFRWRLESLLDFFHIKNPEYPNRIPFGGRPIMTNCYFHPSVCLSFFSIYKAYFPSLWSTCVQNSPIEWPQVVGLQWPWTRFLV